MEELKPCPFCGGEAKYYSDCDMTQIQCAVCGATPSGWWDEPEDAAAAWNRRAAPENKPLTLPGVSERDRQSVYDFLHDCFAEWIDDPAVGLHGMNEGEAALANTIMVALAEPEREENNPMTCKGCRYFDDDDGFEPCSTCSRLIRVNDCYARKPEGSET